MSLNMKGSAHNAEKYEEDYFTVGRNTTKISSTLSDVTKFKSYKLNWTIENYKSLLNKPLQTIISPVFPGSFEFAQRQWYILIICLEELGEKKYKLFLDGFGGFSKLVNISITIFHSSFKVKKFTTTFSWFNNVKNFDIKRSELTRINSKSANITIVCKISFYKAPTELELPFNSCQQSRDLLKQIENSIHDESLKDITFKVDDKKFTAHMLILSLQSPVFEAMFKNNMSEKRTSIVEVEDISATIFEKMLQFLYNNEVNDLKTSAEELFYAAEKYDLKNLKIMCCKSLYENLSCINVLKTLQFADIYSIFELKEACMKFLILNLGTIRESKEFSEFVKDSPQITTEIFMMLELENNEK
ncbi:speckle-type POZ protein B-like [Leptopilina boulardi]|uniref:speckle-type POZ protein B-like n=1 Tax=Leptopilina boulardi TaxID=63433 RepID=UPI0021F65DDD|nr:speckle-type POZ protein B-like [Leptopilina boulardi]